MRKRRIALYHAFHTSLPIMAGYGGELKLNFNVSLFL